MKNMQKMNYSDYLVMFFISLIAGLLTTMNIWADKYSDISLTLNDLYMSLLMTGWMFFFTGIYYSEFIIVLIGIILITINIWFIRKQFLISEQQFKSGMITHHSMAIFMSKKLLEKETREKDFLTNLINTQEREIKYMKNK
jgi:membrane-bound ClpP family serine protease